MLRDKAESGATGSSACAVELELEFWRVIADGAGNKGMLSDRSFALISRKA